MPLPNKILKLLKKAILFLFGITVVIILWDFITEHKLLFFIITGGILLLFIIIGFVSPGRARRNILKSIGFN